MIHYMTTNGIGNPWVGNELLILTREGVPFELHAMVRPSLTHFKSEQAREISERTRALYPSPLLGTLGGLVLAPLLFRRRFFAALWNVLTGQRESLAIRAKGAWHFVVACRWAVKVRNENIDLIHSQWVHSGGTIAMYGAWLLDRPFSFTGHAADLFRDRCALLDKIRRADFIVCISTFHRDFFLDNGARPDQLFLAYCGIDPSLFGPRTEPHAEGHPFTILSSGRLVEKKGFRHLIDACAILRTRGVEFKCVIAGSGELQEALDEQIEHQGLADAVSVTGEPLMQEDIPTFMHSGDVYALPCVWASDNDVDGLPQMLMEAMACGLPVVSTRLVGIPDLVESERSGILVTPGDAAELADALQRLREDQALARRLADAGRAVILDKFDLKDSLDPLIEKFRSYLAIG